MMVAVSFPVGVEEFEAVLLVRDALSNFIKLRTNPTVEAAVANEYPVPHFSDTFRARKVVDREKRITWAEQATVMPFSDAMDAEDIPRYTD